VVAQSTQLLVRQTSRLQPKHVAPCCPKIAELSWSVPLSTQAGWEKQSYCHPVHAKIAVLQALRPETKAVRRFILRG